MASPSEYQKNNLEEIKEILGLLNLKIKERFNAEIIGLFGSYSRGEERADSDLDILVRFDDEATLINYIALFDYLEEKLNMKVDLVSERALRKEIKDDILKEVVMI